jgi:signal transduction histidine kinase
MLAPLTSITDATRIAATGSLAHRIRLPGRRDEFRELADAFDAMLARLEAHVAEQQRFAANASHELRTPLAITQTLLDVARNDPNRDNGELDERLRAVNTRAIDLTEALLVLSRADQRSFARKPSTCRSSPKKPPNAPPLRRTARHHHRDLRRHGSHHRLTRAFAADGDEPRAQRDRPQPA